MARYEVRFAGSNRTVEIDADDFSLGYDNQWILFREREGGGWTVVHAIRADLVESVAEVKQG